MIKPHLDTIESELQHRLQYKYVWYRKQNDQWDTYSNFMYSTVEWESLIPKIAKAVEEYKLNKEEFFYYTINRWYNYWSALAIELIFSEMEGVIPAKNEKDKLVDFSFFGKNFDHKTSVFPKGFGKSIEYAQQHPKELLLWLYRNQSQQGRKHLENRMFLIVYSEDGEHWKLKAQISWLKNIISAYVATFNDTKLHRLQLQPYKTTTAGLIWARK
ncbi:hypothetical protein [Aquimarina sp. MMG016]|uniref:hypothetical protein n=1 Tax=Aquimarina sp. MMG016 TaxID=2822690 RepID=UPI001FFC820E|nr:hypothetical protein [Aquimarina sp. MMG016]